MKKKQRYGEESKHQFLSKINSTDCDDTEHNKV